jgi:hypothetical protein
LLGLLGTRRTGPYAPLSADEYVASKQLIVGDPAAWSPASTSLSVISQLVARPPGHKWTEAFLLDRLAAHIEAKRR